jgi:hypothetical protein
MALLAATGSTLLLPSAFALLAPPELLDAAVELGDRKLCFCVAGLFALSAALARLVMMRRRTPEESLSEQPDPPAVQRETHLR